MSVCDDGYSKADTVTRASVDVLNSLMVDGARKFNAQQFSVLNSWDWDDVHSKMVLAQQWANEPWLIMDSPTVFYAEATCKKAPLAMERFHELMDTINAIEKDMQTKGPLAPVAKQRPRTPKHEKLAPPPPPRPPSKRHYEIEADDADTDQTLKKHKVDDDDDDEHWETTEFDVKNWKYVLNDARVDHVAQKELWLLAQMSEDGKVASNSIIAKILKKAADGETFNNASAFVHTACKNARHRLSWE